MKYLRKAAGWSEGMSAEDRSNMEKKIAWGCIADDFTGAGDAASFFVQGGMHTVLYSGVPKENLEDENCQAIVIALKTRTQETSAAVEETKQAARWLKKQGAEQLYIKYCSTFDSTPAGNIGPVMDALLEEYQIPYTILCPALPVNGRVVRQGHLYVDGVLLHESPMRNHPLTPMWDSGIAELMKTQSRYSCINVTREQYTMPKETTTAFLDTYAAAHNHFYIITDYETDEDAKAIADLFGSLPVLSGGSGVLTELARRKRGKSTDAIRLDTECLVREAGGMKGPGIILAGSCSKRTRQQIFYAKEYGMKAVKIHPLELLCGRQTMETLWESIQRQDGKEILVYSSDSPEQVRKIQEVGKARVAKLLEDTMAALAKRAADTGYTRFIVAGGETSGAVTRALNFDSYLIGESVAPGVPVMIPRKRREIRLVLKSGNFGQENFFMKALERV